MKHGSIGYYETAAQVIPVIVLAIVVEYRIFGGGKTRDDWWVSGRALEPEEKVSAATSLFVVVFGLVFITAEFAAFEASYNGKASAWDDLFVGLALRVGFILVLFVPTQPYFEDLLDRIGPLRRAKLRRWHRGGIPPAEVPPELPKPLSRPAPMPSRPRTPQRRRKTKRRK